MIEDPALDSLPAAPPAAGEEPRAVALPALAVSPARLQAHRAARSLLLAAGDLLALALAGVVAYAEWALPVRGQLPGHYARLAPLVLLFILGYAQAGLYPGLGLGPVERLRRFTYTTVFGFVVVAAGSFALKVPHVYSRGTFAMALVLSLVAVPLCRAALLFIAHRWAWWREPVVVVGPSARGAALARRVEEAPAMGYRVAARLEAPRVGAPGAELEAAVASLAARGVRVAMVAAGAGPGTGTLDLLQRRFEHVVVTGALGELPVEGVLVRNFGGLLGLEYTNNLLRRRNRVTKRGLDLLLGSVLLLLAAPCIAVVAALVCVVSPGPPFFVQRRTGAGGRPFSVPKIRTMQADAERRLAEHLGSDEALEAEWRQHFKLRDDPRLVPGIGRFLRRYSVDELPQLLSVVRGDMSLVGPRPFPDYHLQRFTPEFQELRQRVRPGITGLWQVTVRSAGAVEEQQALDTYYIRNWSVWLDLYVLARTVGAVLAGRGAY